MSVRLCLLVLCCLPACAHADCVGFFNQYEESYKLRNDKLKATGEKVAPGTQLEFNGLAQIKDRFFLTRARSDQLFDAQNVELTSGCNLPTRPPPQAR